MHAIFCSAVQCAHSPSRVGGHDLPQLVQAPKVAGVVFQVLHFYTHHRPEVEGGGGGGGGGGYLGNKKNYENSV